MTVNKTGKMIKIQSNFDNGVEYIRLGKLPLGQNRKFLSWLAPGRIFKMKVNNRELEDCVHYSEYEFWFETQKYQPVENFQFF